MGSALFGRSTSGETQVVLSGFRSTRVSIRRLNEMSIYYFGWERSPEDVRSRDITQTRRMYVCMSHFHEPAMLGESGSSRDHGMRGHKRREGTLAL